MDTMMYMPALEALRDVEGEDRMIIRIRTFIDTSRELVEGIAEKIREENFSKAAEKAEILKSLSSKIGALSFSLTAALIESNIREKNLACVQDLSFKLEGEYEHLEKYLKIFLVGIT